MIEHALGRKQPLVVLSGPSFAIELMEGLPTMLVAASEYPGLAAHAVSLLASPCLRVNISDDVIGALCPWSTHSPGRDERGGVEEVCASRHRAPNKADCGNHQTD